MANRPTDLPARARLRASPHYRFVANGPDWAGSLLPAGPGWRRVHLVTAETAALFGSLGEPAPAPPGADPRAIARLVLDGILEIDAGDEYRSGPAAHALLFQAGPPVAARHRLAELSLAGLRCAESMGIPDPPLLAKCLYRYNSRPDSPSWRRRFPNARAVTRLFESEGDPRVEARWRCFTSAEGGVTWRVWERPDAPIPPARAPTYKLYLSPLPEEVGEATRAVRALGATRCAPFSMKAGYDLPTLLRPEKLVVYFLTRDQLLEAAERLAGALAGMSPQGVPFTAELSGGGLLSWGIDPGSDAEPPGPLRELSWRRWITARLASALATALAAGAPVPPWQYALDRVRLEGADPETWTPPAWFDHPGSTRADY